MLRPCYGDAAAILEALSLGADFMLTAVADTTPLPLL